VAGFELTPRDRDVLRFAAEHRTFLADHVRALLDISAAAADKLLVELHDAGLLERREVYAHQAALHWITREGLAAVDSPLKRPAFTSSAYEHDVGVAFLWLAAHDGTFGPVGAVLSERSLRSSDARRDAGKPPLAVRVGGFGRAGRERLHYPDLLLVDPQGRQIGLELELTDKARPGAGASSAPTPPIRGSTRSSIWSRAGGSATRSPPRRPGWASTIGSTSNSWG
jgi:hypothetical protein